MTYKYEEIVSIGGKETRRTEIDVYAEDETEAEELAASYAEDLEKDISLEYGYPLWDVHVECNPLGF